jgi:hypothetical protein
MVLDLRLERLCRNPRILYLEIPTYQTSLAGVLQGVHLQMLETRVYLAYYIHVKLLVASIKSL